MAEFPKAKNLKVEDQIKMGDYGTLTQEEFFTKFHPKNYDKNYDHNLLKITGIIKN